MNFKNLDLQILPLVIIIILMVLLIVFSNIITVNEVNKQLTYCQSKGYSYNDYYKKTLDGHIVCCDQTYNENKIREDVCVGIEWII